MPQSDGRNTLKRMEFTYGNTSFKFTLNPEEYTQTEPTRSTVTQTKGGAWIDDFGRGLPTITMRGTTGVKKGGFATFKAFRDFIRNYMEDGTFGNERTEELIFYNYTDGESWVVHIEPSGFKLSRSKSSPLIYNYELTLICLRHTWEASNNSDVSITEKELVNSAGTTTSLGATTYIEQQRQAYNKILENKITDKTLSSSSSIKKRTENTTSTFAPKLNVNGNKVTNGFKPSLSPYLMTFSDNPLDELDFDFDNTISSLAKETYEKIINGEIKSFSFENRNSDFAVRLHKFMNSYVENNIKAIVGTCCLELYSIGINDVNSYHFFNNMTKKDMERLISNLSYIIDLLGDLQNADWELIRDFRMLQRCVMTLYNSDIYNVSIKDELNAITNAQKVGDKNELR